MSANIRTFLFLSTNVALSMPLCHIFLGNLYASSLTKQKLVKKRINWHYRFYDFEKFGVDRADVRYVFLY
jgi:hypothetical protein